LDNRQFGIKIREWRRQAHLTQKELAGEVGIDFTYLSKIENGVMPPPSEKVIARLAGVLNIDKDELMALAGKVPADVARLISNSETLKLLKSPHTQKMIGASTKMRRSLKMINYKSLSKVAIAIVLVIALSLSLWFSSPTPVKAVELTIPSLPLLMYPGQVYGFFAQVDINTDEQIPINSMRLNINGPTPGWVEFAVDGNITASSDDIFSITPVIQPEYQYGYRYAYGYGYQPPPAEYRYFSHYWGYGYGYGYGYGSGLSAQARYLCLLNTTHMTYGSYSAQLFVNTGPGDKKFVSPLYSFTVSPMPGGGGGGGNPPKPPTVYGKGVIHLSPYLDIIGRTTNDITLTSSDGQIIIVIPAETKLFDADGKILKIIEIVLLHTPPPPPGYTLVGPAYDCRPDGASFTPELSLTFAYNPAAVPLGTGEGDLVMAQWDGSGWIMLPTTVDTENNTVTANVSHFTAFAILGRLPSPDFTVSNLAISPPLAAPGQTINISVMLSNTGNGSGSYSANLKINTETVETKQVILEGGTSKEITFSVTENTAGTYTVNVNGLPGEFVIKSPATFELSQFKIEPPDVNSGESVTISAVVTNTGQSEGRYMVSLKIDGAVASTREISLSGGQKTTVIFTIAREAVGTYAAQIGTLSGSFTVSTLVNWTNLIVILAAVVVAIVAIILMARRNRYS